MTCLSMTILRTIANFVEGCWMGHEIVIASSNHKIEKISVPIYRLFSMDRPRGMKILVVDRNFVRLIMATCFCKDFYTFGIYSKKITSVFIYIQILHVLNLSCIKIKFHFFHVFFLYNRV